MPDCDAVITGGGIAGLVCGCYLAKSGLKTAIIEKNHRPGGYCTSFEKDGYTFDACVHSLGGLRSGGIFSRVLDELDLHDCLEFYRYDPSDVIVSPSCTVSFFNDTYSTISDFQESFPDEKDAIKRFFTYAEQFRPRVSGHLLNITFADLLRQFFRNETLMAVLAMPVLGNGGLPPSLASAFACIMMYREFFLDGGYYPGRGINSVPEALENLYNEYGGCIVAGTEAVKFNVDGDSINSVNLDNGEQISGRYFISSGDGTNCLLSMIGDDHLSDMVRDRVTYMEPSLSAFLLYLGMEPGSSMNQANIWHMPGYNVDHMYNLIHAGRICNGDVPVGFFPHGNSLCVFMNAPFMDESFWQENADIVSEHLLQRAQDVLPDTSGSVVAKHRATPLTLHKRTMNLQGAAYGWAPAISQYIVRRLQKNKPFNNLFFAGHWTSTAHGVSGAAASAREAGLEILEQEGRISQ